MCMFECPFLFLVYIRMDAGKCYHIVNKIKQLASEWVSEWVVSEWVSEWVGLRLPCSLSSSLFGTFLSSIFAACGWHAVYTPADKLLKCIMFSSTDGWIAMWKPYVWCNHPFVSRVKSYFPIHISKYLTANVHLYNCEHVWAPTAQSTSHPATYGLFSQFVYIHPTRKVPAFWTTFWRTFWKDRWRRRTWKCKLTVMVAIVMRMEKTCIYAHAYVNIAYQEQIAAVLHRRLNLRTWTYRKSFHIHVCVCACKHRFI